MSLFRRRPPANIELLGLEDFVPALSRRFTAPRHLRPVSQLVERIAHGEEIRAVVSCPPRHGKTELFLHAIPWLLLQRPELQIAYASYAARIAEKKSRKARELSQRAGVPIADDSRARADWRTGVDDGGVWATSVEGAITGEGFDVVLLDDLIKGRAEAESGTIRERTHEWLVADVLSRVEPGGSVILFMARWHPEDPAGRMIGAGWEHVSLEAIASDTGAALWPERWPLSALLPLRETMGGADGYEWTSLYMGQPRGRGSRVFGDVVYFDERPRSFSSVSIGLDFAYSTRTSADYSVAVVLAESGGLHYVLDVVRVHEQPRDFRARVQLLARTYSGARVCAYAAATEMGGIEFLRDGGIAIEGRTATADKFSRAIPVAAAWNQGRILLPRSALWLNPFVSEVCGFTGVKDRHDDQVDALAAAFDATRASAINMAEWDLYQEMLGGGHELDPLFVSPHADGPPHPCLLTGGR